MIKKSLAIISSILIISFFYFSSFTPVFDDYASEHELYLSAGSTGETITVTTAQYYLYSGICGESCKIEKADFDLDRFFLEMDAKVVFIEKVKGVVSYYCYSPCVKYKKLLYGKVVNLHVAVAESQVTVGAPIIYGSF